MAQSNTPFGVDTIIALLQQGVPYESENIDSLSESQRALFSFAHELSSVPVIQLVNDVSTIIDKLKLVDDYTCTAIVPATLYKDVAPHCTSMDSVYTLFTPTADTTTYKIHGQSGEVHLASNHVASDDASLLLRSRIYERVSRFSAYTKRMEPLYHELHINLSLINTSNAIKIVNMPKYVGIFHNDMRASLVLRSVDRATVDLLWNNLEALISRECMYQYEISRYAVYHDSSPRFDDSIFKYLRANVDTNCTTQVWDAVRQLYNSFY